MPKLLFSLFLAIFLLGTFACSSRPSKVEQMRLEKQQRDSIKNVQAQQNLHYSDSLLQRMLSQTDSLMQYFVYSKNETYEDHGHYVHRLLQTSANVSRNFLQASISDNKKACVQSYYFGSAQLQQYTLRLSVGEDFVEKEGSNHAFQSEGWHEILTIQDEDALHLLAFVTSHEHDRVRVTSKGVRSVEYYLTPSEKKALTDTYHLAVLMRDVDALERAIHVANLQIQKYEKKRLNGK